MSNEKLFITIIISASIIAILIALPWLVILIRKIFKKTNYDNLGQSSKIRLIHSLNEATSELSASKTGALITIVNKQPIEDFRTDGIKIDANISATLILSIFNKKSPIHDGAIIIKDNKIAYAGTYYKITSRSINNKYGARHRAAMGISEQTDALTIVISEENGGITFAKQGQLIKIKQSEFQEKITEYLK